MKVINLLPESEIKELRLELTSKQLFRFFTIIVISLIIMIAALISARLYISGQISVNNVEIQNLESQLNSSDNQALQKEILALNEQIKNIKTLSQQQYRWSLALTQLANLTPDDFHLDLVTFDRSNGEIVVNGVADNRDSVLTFWSNVKKSSIFQNINFPLKNLEKPTDTPFTFTFKVNPALIQNK